MSSAQKTDVYPFVQQDPMEYSAEFARRRVEEPVSRVELASGETAWLLTRYADIRAVLSDDRFQPWVPGMSADDGYGMIFTMSGPGHARLRRLAARALTPRRVGLLEPRIRRHADDLVAKLVAKGPGADLLENLALPLAMSALGELLGVPAGEWDRLGNWAGGLSEVISASTATEMAELGAKLGGYVVSLIEAKRAEPGEDLLSELIAVEDQGDRLEDGELTSLVFAFFLAGYLPPANALASGVLQLLREGRLRASEAVPDVVEELLAADQSSATDQSRVATEDVEVGGALIRAGEFVLAPLRAANQDPARGEGPHLTFGHGPHRCLGAALARMELTSGLGALLAGPGEFSLAVPWADLGWRPLFLTLQGPTAVPLTW